MLRPPARERLDTLMRLIADFDREIVLLKQRIDVLARDDARVPILTRIPGVGPYIAMLVIAEVGDVERFPSARHLCAFAGLTPTVRSSDGKVRLGHISRQGSPHLRWALVEAANSAVRRGGPLRTAFERIARRRGGPLRTAFERIARRRGRKIAKVAVARKILTLAYYGLRDGEIRCLNHDHAKLVPGRVR